MFDLQLLVTRACSHCRDYRVHFQRLQECLTGKVEIQPAQAKKHVPLSVSRCCC